jgi:hypothetical protein
MGTLGLPICAAVAGPAAHQQDYRDNRERQQDQRGQDDDDDVDERLDEELQDVQQRFHRAADRAGQVPAARLQRLGPSRPASG